VFLRLESRSLALTALLFVLLFATALSGQESLLRNHPGKWTALPPIKPLMAEELSAADRAAATSWANQILEIIHRMPSLAQPVGFDVTPFSSAELSSLDRGPDEKGPRYISGMVEVDLPAYKQTASGIVTDDRNVAGTITIAVNDISAVAQGGLGDSAKPYVDQSGRFFTSTAEPVDTLHGYPVYRVVNDQWVVMRRNDVPFFVPVSRQRFLQYNIDWTEANLGKARANLEKNKATLANAPNAANILKEANEALAAEQSSLDEARKILAAMTPEQRAAPAFIEDAASSGSIPRLLEPNSEGANAVVSVNPALMDPNLPRYAPQVIAVRITTDDPNWPEFAERLDSEIDWQALDKMLHPNP